MHHPRPTQLNRIEQMKGEVIQRKSKIVEDVVVVDQVLLGLRAFLYILVHMNVCCSSH